jgi:murein DD-endopeptidase MepM/ murein hydrolase activator NlpD
VASNRHAPEGTYDPYLDDEESGRYGDYGSSYGDDGAYHRQFGSSYGRDDDYASQLTEVYEAQGHEGGPQGHDTFPGHEAPYATHDFGTHDFGTQDFGTQEFATGAFATQEFAAREFGTHEPGTHEFGAQGHEFETSEYGKYEFGPDSVPPVPDAFGPDSPSYEEWNPTEDSVRPVRGRHKLAKQRGGSMARSGAVLGVGMIAAVGAGGMATAQEKPSTAISMPDVAAAADKAKDLPGVKLLSGGSDETVAGQPLTQAALTESDTQAGRTDAGEALRSRILQQAQQQQSAAEASAREAAVDKAADAARAKAAKAEKKQVAAERAKAEDARLAKLAKSFKLPVSGYQLTSQFGDSGGLWVNGHTGTDFAASSGTPIRAIHSGTVKEAGWAGSFGYRTILKLDDGTELWFCHQSSMNVSAGQKVRTGELIGRVGSTGNVTGAHLHLEVHPGGGDAIDPAAWLRGKGLSL